MLINPTTTSPPTVSGPAAAALVVIGSRARAAMTSLGNAPTR